MIIDFPDRQDEGLAFMQKFENVAWYEDGVVRILDRRIYPIRTEFVTCTRHEEVARAIREMITQSEGPYTAAAMGMALAAHEMEKKSDPAVILDHLQSAAWTLSHARPTTSAQMQGIVDGAVELLRKKLSAGVRGAELTECAFRYAYDYINNNYRRYSIIGRYMAEQIPDHGTVMTQCFGGTIVGTMLRECRRMGKDVKVICPETRPYCQGARLTASVASDMGFDTTVISDNMPAWAMASGKVDVFTSASDVITMDGHVVNKVGTLQIAIAAARYGIPYYVTGTPDPKHADISTVVIEERNPRQVREMLGTQITKDAVKGWYPAFDVTPPELVTGIATDQGIFSPDEVRMYVFA